MNRLLILLLLLLLQFVPNDLHSQSGSLNDDRSLKAVPLVYPNHVELIARGGAMWPDANTSQMLFGTYHGQPWTLGAGAMGKGYYLEGALNFVGNDEAQSKLGFMLLAGISLTTVNSKSNNWPRLNSRIGKSVVFYELGCGPSMNRKISDNLHFNAALTASILFIDFSFQATQTFEEFSAFGTTETRVIHRVEALYVRPRGGIEFSFTMNNLAPGLGVTLGTRFSWSSVESIEVDEYIRIRFTSHESGGNTDIDHISNEFTISDKVSMNYISLFVGFNISNKP
jgi:hypothetical protein